MSEQQRQRRIVLGVSGASGVQTAQVLVKALARVAEVHLVISSGAERVALAEGGMEMESLRAYAHTVYAPDDMAAGMASGSWRHGGMIVCPCSMASLAAIATGCGTTLVHRAADVCLKERRPLVIVPRETPLSPIHLRHMLSLSEDGARIMPFCPAFYGRSRTLDDVLEHFAGRVLDQFDLEHSLGVRWKE